MEPLISPNASLNNSASSPTAPASPSASTSTSTAQKKSTAGGVSERKLPSAGGNMLAINSEHKLRAENLPFDIDVWYPQLAAHTFASIFTPLTRTEARAIMNYQETRYNSRPKLTDDGTG
jgi:hypothetical protein